MQVTKVSTLTGVTHTIDIPNLTQDQVNDWMSGTLIQKAMPHLSSDHRGVGRRLWPRRGLAQYRGYGPFFL
jgi:hypothetical protein